jgi:hypothetical protein
MSCDLRPCFCEFAPYGLAPSVLGAPLRQCTAARGRQRPSSAPREEGMSTTDDHLTEIQHLFLARDEINSMLLDRVFAVIDQQIDLAQARIARGERPAVVFAGMRDAMARMRKASY